MAVAANGRKKAGVASSMGTFALGADGDTSIDWRKPAKALLMGLIAIVFFASWMGLLEGFLGINYQVWNLSTYVELCPDRIVRAIADAGVRNARRLAQMANEDTGFGIVDDKVIKNVFASRGVYEHIKDMKTIGEISCDPARGVHTIAVPVGVIAGLIPSTNPTSTALYKAEIAIKAGNAIVFSPHPTALRCILETVKVIRQAVSEAGGNEDLVSCITIPTMEATDNLMRHRDVAMILATGGSAMVRAAYSSGTPAIGVGPGNGPAYLEKSCDLPLAVKRILDSKTFDNGTICASEQSIICDEDMVVAVQAEMEKQGAYFLDEAEREGAADHGANLE